MCLLCLISATQVRHTLEKQIYGKNSSTPTYTQKIFKVTKKEGNAYYLDDLTKPFREHELILATGENNNERDEEEKIIIQEKEEKNQKKELKNLEIDQPNYKKEKERERGDQILSMCNVIFSNGGMFCLLCVSNTRF